MPLVFSFEENSRIPQVLISSLLGQGFALGELENEVTNIDGLASDALRLERPHEPTLLVRTITRIKTPARMPSMLPQKLWDCDHYQNL